MRELNETLAAWQSEGHGIGRAIVVRTFGSAPRPEGAVMLVADDGRLAGSVSGGCVEGAAFDEVERARRTGRSRVIRYGISDEQAWDVGLACGGTIDVLMQPEVPPLAARAAAGRDGIAVITPLPADSPGPDFGPHQPGEGSPPAELLTVTEDGVLSGTLGDPLLDAELVSAAQGALDAGTSRTVELAGRSLFIEAYPVPSRLIVVGAVQVAMPLVRMARELGYETVVIDGRATFATHERFPDADRVVVGWPDEVADEIGLDCWRPGSRPRRWPDCEARSGLTSAVARRPRPHWPSWPRSSPPDMGPPVVPCEPKRTSSRRPDRAPTARALPERGSTVDQSMSPDRMLDLSWASIVRS